MSGWYGYADLFAIVFAETGLLVGFFLPGDSLLFTVGVVAGAGKLNIVLINVAPYRCRDRGRTARAIASAAKPVRMCSTAPIHASSSSEHLVRTQEFYDKHGGKTIIYAQIRAHRPHVCSLCRGSRRNAVSPVRLLSMSSAASAG